MALFTTTAERDALLLLERIAKGLERIANHFDLQRAGSSSFIGLDQDTTRDGSHVSYVDDAYQFMEEQKRLEYMTKTGRIVRDWEAVPGPLSEEGKEWAPTK